MRHNSPLFIILLCNIMPKILSKDPGKKFNKFYQKKIKIRLILNKYWRIIKKIFIYQ